MKLADQDGRLEFTLMSAQRNAYNEKNAFNEPSYGRDAIRRPMTSAFITFNTPGYRRCENTALARDEQCRRLLALKPFIISRDGLPLRVT